MKTEKVRACGAIPKGIARRVIVAAGSAKPHLPAWVNQIQTQHPAARMRHWPQVDLRNLQLHGKQTLIVGGGLTRGHLAVGSIAREAQVLLRTRRYFPEKLFDTEPGWLGPKYLKGFAAEPDCHSRWETIQQARNGGSMTPEIRMRIIFDRWFSRPASGASRKKPFWGDNGVRSHCTGDRQIQHCTLALASNN